MLLGGLTGEADAGAGGAGAAPARAGNAGEEGATGALGNQVAFAGEHGIGDVDGAAGDTELRRQRPGGRHAFAWFEAAVDDGRTNALVDAAMNRAGVCCGRHGAEWAPVGVAFQAGERRRGKEGAACARRDVVAACCSFRLFA
jgi:hypothetical protein